MTKEEQIMSAVTAMLEAAKCDISSSISALADDNYMSAYTWLFGIIKYLGAIMAILDSVMADEEKDADKTANDNTSNERDMSR